MSLQDYHVVGAPQWYSSETLHKYFNLHSISDLYMHVLYCLYFALCIIILYCICLQCPMALMYFVHCGFDGFKMNVTWLIDWLLYSVVLPQTLITLGANMSGHGKLFPECNATHRHVHLPQKTNYTHLFPDRLTITPHFKRDCSFTKRL